MSTSPFFGTDTHVVHDGHFLSVEMMELAGDIRQRYPNLKLAWIPPEFRGEHDQGREFAILDTYNGDEPVMRMATEQVNPNYIFNWLWENDGTREGNSALDRLAKLEIANAKKVSDAKKEENDRLADFYSTVVRSGKSDFKHNGIKLTDHPDSLGGMLENGD